MSLIKKSLAVVFVLIGLIFIITWSANYIIEKSTRQFTSSQIEQLPKVKVGLLLGTSKTLASGQANLYFKYRIEAAATLYQSGKIQNIIVSGDNSVKGYNETKDMKLDLIAKGVPENKIFEDFAGFRTLDSVIRAKNIFGQTTLIIISQKFHNERAIYLAQKNGIKAFGFNAKDVTKKAGFKTQVREKLARVKVFYDFLFQVEPKFGGKKILIP